MPSTAENTAIQVIEAITGGLSVVACVIMSRKIWMERSMHVTNSMLLSLFFIDFMLGILYAIGRSATFNDGLCQTQAFFLQWFEVAAMLWTILMSYLMYNWIVRKKHPKRMEKTIKRFQILLFVSSFLLALILLVTKTYGTTYLWCWVENEYEWVRVLCFEAILLAAWIINMTMLQLVFASIKSRVRRTSVHARLGSLLDSTVAIQRKLLLYVSAFLFLWLFAVINRFVEYGTGQTNFVTSLLQVIFLPLQGLVNALCYGDYIDIKQVIKAIDISTFFTYQDHDHKNLLEVFIEPIKTNITKTDHIKSYVPKKYSIFTTTLNVGEASLQSIVGDIKDWIVEGHDVYAIGVQECLDIAGLREAISNHLGGPNKYTMYTAAIGSGNTRLGYHGFIALTVFVKTSELLAGSIHATATTAKTMATGTDLIITTAQNKGAVGIPLQIHDTSIGFVTCHLPSDSKGKSKLVKRNASAHSILKEVILAPEDLGFDLHLQHDHILVFGDLNYRMETDGVGGGVNSLTGVAVACTIEKQILNDDPLWIARKYNLLRHSSDPLHPTIEEVKLIQEARLNSRGAWKSVLRADELRSIMDDGDAFCGFDEPMPCFPPSYKRKKGKIEGDCGDYSSFSAIIRGFSHTGYIENILDRPPSGVLKPPSPLGNQSPRSAKTKSTKLTKIQESDEIIASVPFSNKSSSGDSSLSLSSPSMPSDFIMETGIRESDSERFSDEDDNADARREAAAARAKRRRKAMLNKEVSGIQKEDSVYETDPTKLRPPSYTDRILMHSLSDRASRVTVQSYDFCDTLRVSDHRAVSMTILLEVNTNVIYQGAAENSDMITEHPEYKEKEPKFELYELIITDLSVVVLDLKMEEDEEDALKEGENEKMIAVDGSNNGEVDIKHVSTQSVRKKDNFEEANPMFRKKSLDLSPTSTPSPSTSTVTSPFHNADSLQNENSPKKKKKVVSVKFSSENDPEGSGGPGHQDIEMQSVDSGKGIRFDSNTTENSNTSHTSDQPLTASTNDHHDRQSVDENSHIQSNPDRNSATVVVKHKSAVKSNRKKSFWSSAFSSNNESNDIEQGNRSASFSSASTVVVSSNKKGRKKSMFAVFFSSNTENEEEETSERKTDIIEDEDTILRNMAEQSLDWKNTLHQPGEWRKKVLEEQRREREKEKNNSLALKKKHKSDEKMIYMVTVVFPLPSKDPLLVYRKMYDYSQAFDIEDKSQKAFGRNEASSNISKEELLKAMTQFRWYPKPTITYAHEKSPFQRNQSKFESDQSFKLKGCASYELGAHALLKFTNRLGYEFGSSVVCVSHLIHKDPKSIHSSHMKDIPLSAGGQKRGFISGKFSLRFIPSALSDDFSPL